ncbi:MAG: serine/threonine-protein kinase [Candidatus Eisenbacteria bacterium]
MFLTMEYVPGRTLAQRLGERPSWEVALDYGRQIAAALEAAQARAIVHRDLKPQNIRITPEGWIKVLDFGLAYRWTDGDDPTRALRAGTPGYMSPEQCRGDTIDHRSDLWALGAILFECFTGKPAITGDSLVDLLESNRRGDVDLSDFGDSQRPDQGGPPSPARDRPGGTAHLRRRGPAGAGGRAAPVRGRPRCSAPLCRPLQMVANPTTSGRVPRVATFPGPSPDSSDARTGRRASRSDYAPIGASP